MKSVESNVRLEADSARSPLRSRSATSRSALRSTPPDYWPTLLRFPLRSHALHVIHVNGFLSTDDADPMLCTTCVELIANLHLYIMYQFSPLCKYIWMCCLILLLMLLCYKLFLFLCKLFFGFICISRFITMFHQLCCYCFYRCLSVSQSMYLSTQKLQ